VSAALAGRHRRKERRAPAAAAGGRHRRRVKWTWSAGGVRREVVLVR
jgi:hypothetical protein